MIAITKYKNSQIHIFALIFSYSYHNDSHFNYYKLFHFSHTPDLDLGRRIALLM